MKIESIYRDYVEEDTEGHLCCKLCNSRITSMDHFRLYHSSIWAQFKLKIR
jgi:hypothetical protein